MAMEISVVRFRYEVSCVHLFSYFPHIPTEISWVIGVSERGGGLRYFRGVKWIISELSTGLYNYSRLSLKLIKYKILTKATLTQLKNAPESQIKSALFQKAVVKRLIKFCYRNAHPVTDSESTFCTVVYRLSYTVFSFISFQIFVFLCLMFWFWSSPVSKIY